MATLDDRAVERLVGGRFEARTPNTITDLDRLLAELAQVRVSGVAFDREEHTLGVAAAGIALNDSLGNPLAISVPVPSQRFAEAEHMIAERLLEAKHALEVLAQQG